jgi:hypothetical protein
MSETDSVRRFAMSDVPETFSTTRVRHDRGPRLTPRDLACLLWIARQYAIRLDQLQRLLLRYTPEQDRHKLRPDTDRLSLERTYDTLERWRTLGLIEQDNILHADKLWIWLSRMGLREIRHEQGRSDKGEQQPHMPDALLYAMSGKITAIEVERRLKDEGTLEETLRTLAMGYRSVWYFASRPAKKKIYTMLETFTPEMRKPFVLYDLGEYGHEYGVS